ncbi:MAG: hypothetical protein GY780_08835 [bacterium]|nr:hypothetical protein [bacterium]
MYSIFGNFFSGFLGTRSPNSACLDANPNGLKKIPNIHQSVGQLLLLTLLLLSGVSPVQADPNYQGNLMYGIDPVISSTDNPRLLGVDRLVMRERLLKAGIDPLKDGGKSPQTKDAFRKAWVIRANVDLEHMERLVEYNRPLGLMTVIEYPSFFYLFPPVETLPGGITYYPPRPLGDSVVKVFVDDIEQGAARTQAVDRILVRDKLLGGENVGVAGSEDGLINLTIPIKLPRTLEKIIGRGEKTRIKITGREHIKIAGESSVVNPFTPTERVTSQSLFPSLDMEQELQVNLSGVIGEKIIIEVDHNSAAMGPDATKIKLMYQGDEDEIIRTIETGDVGLTLPGSRLLGYSSNKSGLFGVKVTGQMGRADFTTVLTKQKAESSAKTFNSKGGEVEDNVILSHNYLNNRFFRVDLPPAFLGHFYPVSDSPGRNYPIEKIQVESIQVFKMMGVGQLGSRDVSNVAVYVDSTGSFWQEPGSPTGDFQDTYTYGPRWRELDYDLMLDVDGNLVALDMRQQMFDEDVLAVIYNVVDENGTILYRVGDRPGQDEANRVTLPNEGSVEYYRMKLLKAPVNHQIAHPFYYVLRNIYPLGGANIDIDSFELTIERALDSDLHPELDENEIPYIRIFGLDRQDAQGADGHDNQVDKTDGTIFDLRKGLLKFPLDFYQPFAAGESFYTEYANDANFVWDPSFLKEKQSPELYDPEYLPSEYSQYGAFRIVARHAATASSFNLGVSNIEEGSEVVTLDGRTLTQGTDYEIDYTFGQIELKGDAANLSSDSKVSVTYSYAPFFGGGQTSLVGMNLNYDLGRESSVSTTWLYQSESIVGEKAKLGEEPSKTLVGNVNLGHTFKPYFLTHVANFLSLRNTERESSLQINAEAAISLPNPNTKGQVYLEDFEGVDASDIISLTRQGWGWGSPPFQGENYLLENGGAIAEYEPEHRVENLRWFTPKERTERRMLNPDLINQERGETQQVMDLYMDPEDDSWDPEDWGGIVRGISRTGTDLSKSQFIEIWVNDGQPDQDLRSGKLHIDFGYISEDGFWPLDDNGEFILGAHEQEDGILPDTQADGVWTYEEDIGLDYYHQAANEWSAEYGDASDPYPRINNTGKNNREDNEDINKNGILDRDNGYFTTIIDLKETEALVDVVYDYDDVDDLVSDGISWRKYRIRIGDIDKVERDIQPNIQAVTHTRIWFEDDSPTDSSKPVHLQLSEFKFLGSRWEREGVRRTEGEVLLTDAERLPGEEFFLGEVNNKENPDYYSPFNVHEVQNIPEKEQSLVLEYRNLAQGHMARASKQVSPQGDDYTTYRDMSWYWFNPAANQADMDLFFRVGADTLNYYEIGYKFANSAGKTGWQSMSVNIAELSNVKNGTIDDQGVVHGDIGDTRNSDVYHVRVVGRPDLRKVKRYYWVVANNDLSEEQSGYFYLNDIKLEGVKTEMGMAQSAGARLNMADVFKLDFDWSKQDAEYHGLDQRVGSGQTSENWGLTGNLNVDDYIPLAGFRLPVNASRQQGVIRPKYETNSDVEILDEETKNSLSNVETRERFSARLNHAPSKAFIPRYLVDPWVVQASGARSSNRGPLDEQDSKNLSGSVNYDLRISGNNSLGDLPLLGKVPIIKSLNVIPSKVAMGAAFTSTYRSRRTIDEDGGINQQPIQKSRPLTLTSSLDYAPMQILSLVVGGNSERDLLREYDKFGMNIGMENKRLYNVQMTVIPPKMKSIPSGTIFAPLRWTVKGIGSLKPSVQYSGGYVDDHNPNIAQTGDPSNVRTVSNSNRWDLRGSIQLGNIFKKILPEKKFSQAEKQKLIETERNRQNQAQRRGAVSEETEAFPPEWANLPPDERARLEAEFLLEQAEERLAKEEEEARTRPGEEEPEEKSGGFINFTGVYNAVTHPFRKIKPLKITFSDNRSSSYGRLHSTTPFWYKTGFQTSLDVPDSTYAGFSFLSSQSLSLSSATQLTRSLSLDLKYTQKLDDQIRVGSSNKKYNQVWPDASVAFSGLEKWRIFGGGGQEIDSGWFRTANFNMSYKRTKSVTNITPISYNPTTNTTLNPRLAFTFHSGLNATLSSTYGFDHAIGNGVITDKKQLRFGLQVRHQFKAQAFLAKLGLYRPGSNPTINMDIDTSYAQNRTERFNPGSTTSTPTGTTRISVAPRFGYQVTRNLSGAVTFSFGRNKNLATNVTTTSMGLGVEATFVF